MANQKQTISTMKIEDIHAIERFMFWFERLAILIQVLLFLAHGYLMAFTALLFVATNTIFIALSVERQFIRRFFFEPDAIFYIERPAILLQILHHVVPRGFGYWAVIGLVVLIFTNFVMINRYFSTGEQEKLGFSKNSLSSETKSILNGKDTVKDDDMEKKQKKKAMIKDRLLKKLDLGAGLQDDHMKALIAPSQNSSFNHSDLLLHVFHKVEAFRANSNPLETSSSKAMKVEDDSKEAKAACDEPVKTVEDEVEENSKKSYADIAMADEVKEKKDDQKEGATDLEADNHGWEKVQNDLSGKLCDAAEPSLGQKKTDETKDEHDDSSWEQVQNTDDGKLGAEIEPSSQKKADELEDQKEEDTVNSDEISWVEGANNISRQPIAPIERPNNMSRQPIAPIEGPNNMSRQPIAPIAGPNNMSRRHIAPISSAEIALKWDQEISNLTARLVIATQQLTQCEEATVEGTETDEQLRNLEKERRKLKMEKEYLQDAIASLERERQRWIEVINALNERNDALNERNNALNERNYALNGRNNALNGRISVLNERNNALNATINNADENVQYCQTLVNNFSELCLRLSQLVSEDHYFINKLTADKEDLLSKIEAARSSAESYKVNCSQSEEHCEYYKARFEEYEAKYSQLKEENDNLSSKLSAETSLAERFRTVVEMLENRCRSLEAEKAELTANISAARASAELYRGLLHDLAF